MPIVKLQHNLSGDNKGSSKQAIMYLEKENRYKKKEMRKNESFFNQFGTNFGPAEAIRKLDSNRKGLKKGDSKYFSITIAPSKKELANLSDEELKKHAINAMRIYAKNFNRNIDANDIVWFAKLEHHRKHKGFKSKKSDKLPEGVKSGEFKPGDNRHLHILVRRKTEKGVKISPLSNARNTNKSFGKSIKQGFDRIQFSLKVEALLLNKIRNKKPGFKIGFEDLITTRYLAATKNYKKALKLGMREKEIQIFHKANLSSKDKINLAVKFHLENKYKGKIPNISFGNQLVLAVKERYGYVLSKQELKQVHERVRGVKKYNRRERKL